jgi:hypothetical protein
MDMLDIAADRLSGVADIAKFLGVTKRRGLYLLETRQIPSGKEGKLWIASKQALRERHRQPTGGRVTAGGGKQMDQFDIAADCLRGAAEIAAFLGTTRRRAFYLMEFGQMPAGKEGRIWIASRRALEEHYRRLTGAPMPTTEPASGLEKLK